MEERLVSSERTEMKVRAPKLGFSRGYRMLLCGDYINTSKGLMSCVPPTEDKKMADGSE